MTIVFADGNRRKSHAHQMWWAAIAVGLIYWLGSLGRSDIAFQDFAAWPKFFVISLKATATGLLVVSAWSVANRNETRLLATALAIIWAADIILALGYAVPSGFVFVFAHAVAATAYFKLRSRHKIGSATMIAAIAVPIAGMAGHLYATWHLNLSILFIIFPLFSMLVAMLATLSKFSFWPLAAGTILFTVSDVAAIYSLYAPDGHGLAWLTWLSYFGGLVLIVRGLLHFLDFEH
jgi:hypothetical protein